MHTYDLIVRGGLVVDGTGFDPVAADVAVKDSSRRLRQRADGYRATVVSGSITYRDGEATGALPGRLVRGAQRSSEGT